MNATQNNTQYKNSPLGLIPEDWEVKTLGEVTTIKGDYGINAAAVDFDEKLPVYIRITDIDEDGNFSSEKKKSVNDINSSNFYLSKNDLVFVRTGATVGKSYLYNENDGKLVFAGFLIRFRIDTSKASDYFLWSLTKAKPYWDWVTSVSMRSGQPGINSSEYSSLKVPIPPLPEQTAIANCLSTWDKAIAVQTQIIAQKELRKKALANRLLTGKVRLKGFEKVKWVEKKADVLFRNNTDKSHNGELEILSASQERGIVPRSSNNIDIKYDVNSLGSYKKVEVGDYVISLRSFQGGIEYSEYEGIVSPAYTILKEIIPVSKIFYKVYFKTETFINRLNTIIYGIRDGKQIGFKDFATLKLPYPSIEEQTAIANILQCADEEIQLLKKKLQQLKDQKKGLMQVLLTGKKRLRY
jgi:type I restriction enzyme S subunit